MRRFVAAVFLLWRALGAPPVARAQHAPEAVRPPEASAPEISVRPIPEIPALPNGLALELPALDLAGALPGRELAPAAPADARILPAAAAASETAAAAAPETAAAAFAPAAVAAPAAHALAPVVGVGGPAVRDSLASAGRALDEAPARSEQALDALFGEDARRGSAWRRTVDAFRVLPDPERNRAFWRWTLGQAVLNAGMSVHSTALPKIVGEGPAQESERGLNRAAGWAAQAASSLVTGPVADRKPPLAVVVWSYTGVGLLLLSAPVLFVAGYWSFGIFTTLAGAVSFALAAAQNAGAVVYNRILGGDVAHYNKANGWLTTINSAVGVVAPLAGAALLVRLGPAAAAGLGGLFKALHLGAFPAVDAALFGSVLSCAVFGAAVLAVAAGYRFFLKVPAAASSAPAAAPRPAVREMFDGLRLAFGNRALRRLMLLSALRVAAADALIFTVLPSFLAGLPVVPLAFALIVSSGNLGTGVASAYLALAKNRRAGAASDAEVLERQGRWSALMRAASWLVYAGLFFSGSVYVAAALLFLNALFQVPANIIWGGLITKTVSNDFPRDQSKVYSAMSFFWIAITMLGALGFGPLLAPLALGIRLQIAVGALLACAVFDLALSRFVFPPARPGP